MSNVFNFPAFFRGEIQTPDGFIIEEVLTFDDMDMEHILKNMPYLFPRERKSLFHLSYPIITSKEKMIIKNDKECLIHIGMIAMKLAGYWERKPVIDEKDFHWMIKCYEFLRSVNLDPEAIRILVLMKHLSEMGRVNDETYMLWHVF